MQKCVSCCTGADNALSKEGVKASNSANNAVDCFVQFDQSKGELNMQSCVSQVTIGEDSSQEMLCTPQRGAQFWELGAEDMTGAVPVNWARSVSALSSGEMFCMLNQLY